MDKINKITVKLISKETKLGDSRLEFNIKGDNLNYVIMNTIRRSIISYIPIYAFNNFNFEKNTSIFHKNYLQLRLKNMPIWGIDNNIDFIEINDKQVDYNEEDDYENDTIDYIDNKTEKNINSSTLKQLTMYLNYKNKTNEIITVTTNDAKFYFSQEQINTPYKDPIPIVKLQPKQEISMSAITTIGIEKQNAMFSACNICCYNQLNENDFNFILESRGQISEKRILEVAIINILKKINSLKNISIDNDNNEGTIIIHKEDHTLGNLIANGLQQHKNIDFAGYNMPHPLSNIIHIHYKTKQSKIQQTINDVIDYYIELFENIKFNINKL